MIHSVDKAKDMARSILPSRWRGAAKSRAHLHRRQRRTVSQSLNALERDPASWDEGVEFGEVFEPDVSMFVSRRRSSDNVSHFERWAIARTRELPKVHRLGALASVLPDGLIGQHAMSHLKRRRELAPDRDDLRVTWLRRALFLERGHLAELLRDLLTVHEGVRWLHRALKSASRVSGTTRIAIEFRALRGHPDVLPFLDWRAGGDGRSWWKPHSGVWAARHVVDLFCRAFHERRDAEAAYRRAIANGPVPDRWYEYVRS